MIKKITNNSLFKDTSIYTLMTMINKAIPFLLLPLLTRYLTPTDYGIVSMFTLLSSVMLPFIGISGDAAISRQYFNQEKYNIKKYVGNVFIILIFSSFLIGFLLHLFSNQLSLISSFPRDYLWTVVLYTVTLFIMNVKLSLWRAQKKSILFSLFNISKTFFNIIFSILLIVFIGLGWEGRIYALLFTGFIFSIVSIFSLIKNKEIKIEFDINYLKNAIAYGFPLIPHLLSGTILSMTDRLFITNMIGVGVTGIYSVGYQIGSIINILSHSFNNAYIPWLYEKLKENQYATKVKIVKFTYIYFVGILLLALGLGILAPIFLNVFLGKAFNESSVYVIWIALGYAFNGMYLMVVNYIFYEQKNSILAMVTFATALLNIVLNYFFIRKFGAIGAAQATTIIFAIKFVVVWVLSAKVHKMPWKEVLLNRN